MKYLSFGCAFVPLFILSACSVSNTRVVERADDLSSAPDWAQVSTPSFEKDGKKYFVGFVELDAQSSRSAVLNMSDEKALSEPMRSLVDEFLDQNQVAEQIRQDAVFGQRIISATRSFRVPMPSLIIVGRYWETISVQTGQSSLRAFSLAEISISDYENAKHNFLTRISADSGLRKVLRDVGKKQRDRVLSARGASD